MYHSIKIQCDDECLCSEDHFVLCYCFSLLLFLLPFRFKSSSIFHILIVVDSGNNNNGNDVDDDKNRSINSGHSFSLTSSSGDDDYIFHIHKSANIKCKFPTELIMVLNKRDNIVCRPQRFNFFLASSSSCSVHFERSTVLK